jgi:transposase InsO family protein
VLGVSPSGYYAWQKNKLSNRARKDERLLVKIKNIHAEKRTLYGSPRIHAELKAQGERCGRKRIARIMRENGIKAKHKRKCKATTDSIHDFPIAPHVLKQNFKTDKPDKIWTADITYCWTSEGWVYLAVVLDLFSRKIVGWSMNSRMTRQLVIDAFLMAYWSRKPEKGLIHHSDKGSQYASYEFQKTLSSVGAIQSMSGTGNCYDNAVTETFFHSFKIELMFGAVFKTREELKSAIFEYIEVFYNRDRRHSTLGYCSPVKFEQYYYSENVA